MLTPWRIHCDGENLRGVLKHAWLEHDVEKVSAERAVERSLQENGWHALEVEFPVRFGQARKLADGLEELFSPAPLIDKCAAFGAVPEPLRERLRCTIHNAYLESSGIRELQTPLRAAVDAFERAVAGFRNTVMKCGDGDLAKAQEAWRNVLAEAAVLKAELNALPHGIVFP